MNRRIAWIEVATPFLKEFILGKVEGAFSDCPEDIQMLDARMDHERDCVRILCQSASFDGVPENGTPPTRIVTMNRRPKR